MSSCKTLIRTPLPSFQFTKPHRFPFSLLGLGFPSPRYFFTSSAASACASAPPPPDETTVENLLTRSDHIERLMKMERRSEPDTRNGGGGQWFPYLDLYKAGSTTELRISEIIEALDPYIMEGRKERIRSAVEIRSYSVCLVVEGLADFGNILAAFRSADALGIQSVHVISDGSKKRYKDNRHVSMGAEKWLDIELWNSPGECFEVLRRCGYRIATTHLGINAGY